MRARGALSFALRESRGARGRLGFLVACVAIGVAAVVAVAGLSDGLEEGLHVQSRELFAADLAVRANRPLPEDLDEVLAEVVPLARRTDVRELATMAGALDARGAITRSRLCELKVVAGTYPFYGELRLDPPGPLDALLDQESAVVAPELGAGLHLGVGDTLRIGGADFRVAGFVLEEPDRLDFSLTLGPRVFLSAAGFERTALLGLGSRVKYRALLRLPDGTSAGDVRAAEEHLENLLLHEPQLRIETYADAQRGVRRGVERFASFLGLVALLSLVLGGIGVAQVTRSWLATRALSIAVWKSLGLRPREIVLLYLGHALLLALAGSLIGGLLGGAVPLVVPRLVPEFLDPGLVRAWQPLALLRGVALGLGVAALFALNALTALWRVPPSLVLRANAEPLAAPRSVTASTLALLALGIFAGAWIQGERVDLALWFTGGLAVLGLALLLGARGLIRVVRAVPRERLGPHAAHGLAALGRPGANTAGVIVSLGLGALVVTTLDLVQTRLEDELGGALPGQAPSLFLVDVQPDQWDGVRSILAEVHAENVDSVPVITARLAAIDGESVERLAERAQRERGRSRWSLTREQRLTWRAELPPSNRLVAGELWSDPQRAEVSLEEDFARDLGVGLGSRLTFDVQGVPLELLVTSLRSIEWESLGINFFVVVEPGVLDDAPHMLLAAARLDPALEQGVQDRLVEGYPNVTLLRVRSILEKLAVLLGKLALGVRVLGGFTIVAALAILGGAVGAARAQRGTEAALLKTLGVTRAGVLLVFATEFALTGAVAGVLGVLGASALAAGFLEHVLELEPELAPRAVALGWGLTVILAVGAGLAASARALAVRPGNVLRG